MNARELLADSLSGLHGPGLPKARGERTLVATLPSGRTLWLRVDPALVPLREMDRLTVELDRMFEASSRALHRNALAIQAQTQSVRKSAQANSRMLEASSRQLLHRMVSAQERLDQHVERSLMPVIEQARMRQGLRLDQVKHAARQDLWNQLVICSALPMMAAFGKQGSPLAQENLVIAISTLVFLFGDSISQLLSGKRGSGPEPVARTNWWTYSAPFANALTIWWLLYQREHRPVVMGDADMAVGRLEEKDVVGVFSERAGNRQRDLCWARVDLSRHITPDGLAELVDEGNRAALVTLKSFDLNPNLAGNEPAVELLRAETKQGVLSALLILESAVPAGTPIANPPPLLTRLRFSWAVAMQKPFTPDEKTATA